MNYLRTIRRMLGITQAQLAAVLGCAQSNISLHEKNPAGSTLPVDKGKRLMEHCQSKGLKVTWAHIYGEADPSTVPLPKPKKTRKVKGAACD